MRASQERLAHQMFHDALTDLPNRALFIDRLDHARARARRVGQPCAVLFLDLDRLEQVNDTLGHEVGDALLVAAVARPRECLRDDEIGLLLEAVTDLGEVVLITDRLLAALDAPLNLSSRCDRHGEYRDRPQHRAG